MAQKKINYESKWKEIENSEQKGLNKSLLNSVQEIYLQAKKEKNTTQIIRALFYQSKILQNTSDQDDVQLQIVQNFINEINSTKGSDKALLQSILAELYQVYYTENQWNINQRTSVEQATSDDFRYWTENIFKQKIEELYLNSIENSNILKKEEINNWSYILEENNSTQELRPTLYDFLAHRAIDFFNTETEYFYGSNFDAKEIENRNILIRETLESLIQMHQQKNKAALAYNEFLLLKKIKKNIDETDYLNFYKKHSDNSFTPYILLETSNFYDSKINSEPSKNFTERKNWTEKSMQILNKIIDEFPSSDLVNQAKNKIKSYHAQDFDVLIESYFAPDMSIPFRVSHKNVDQLYFKVFEFNDETENLLRNYQTAKDLNKQKELNRLIAQSKEIKTFDIKLKSFDDYQTHSTIAKLETLPKGKYLILSSNEPNFKFNKELFNLQYTTLNISEFAMVFRENEILLTHRETGHPISNQTIEVYQNRNNKFSKISELTTNEFGIAKLDRFEDFNRYHYLSFTIKGENIFYHTNYYQPYPNDETFDNSDVKIFTDRSIYRPGQPLYFKLIAYKETKKNKREIIPNQKITVKLFNPNSKEINSIDLTTNEFGTASGEFILPTSDLNGNYSLRIENPNSFYSFSIEDYKRPRFEVEFEPLKETYSLNEEVTAYGKAVAYSGSNIDHAKVTYRVYRQAIYPFWPWWRGISPHMPSEEITHGETQTDAEGKFEISFKAIATEKNKNNENPRTYTYKIIADITDKNGETRTSEQLIKIGDLRYVLNFKIDDRMNLDELDSISIQTENLNGQFNPAKGKITLSKINPPNRILKNFSFDEVDYQLFSKQEFIEIFPHYAYGNEFLKENWEAENPIIQQNFNTHLSKSITFNSSNWKEGYYILKGEIIDGNNRIPYERLIYLYRTNKKSPVDNEIFNATLNKSSYQPGETSIINFSSATENSELLVQIEVNHEIIKTEKISLNKNVVQYKLPILEAHRGNIFVHYYFGKFNEAHSGVVTINVPFENDNLEITTSTFRDKLTPGQEEVWELKISGKNKDKFLAEVLTTMYDSSLDQFRSHNNNFSFRDVYNYSSFGRWNTHRSFGTSRMNSLTKNPLINYSTHYNLSFDQLNYFGFYFGNKYKYYAREVISSPMENALERETTGFNIRSRSEDKLDENIEPEVATLKLSSTDSIPLTSSTNLTEIQPRRILKETAFFFPHLKTDAQGNVKIQFTTPESLTTWKFMATAHTKDLQTAYFETEVKTQKELMVVPNPPRFLRENDQITFSTNVVNLSDKNLSTNVQLLLFDAFTMQSLDENFKNLNSVKKVTIEKERSQAVSWNLSVPKNHSAIIYRIVASSGEFSDGEESTLPVLTNRTLVTETLPIYIREDQNKKFEFEKLKNNISSTLEHFKLTFEMTSNPIWYAIYSLPYLKENNYESSEQIFARLYANLIAEKIIHSNPKIKNIFDDWNAKGELKSKLEHNEELKNLLLEETPWIRQAESETEQMKRIAILFDLNQMNNDTKNTFSKLQNSQSPDGGFPWFNGGNDNRFITTHIISGFGKLKSMEFSIKDKIDGDLDLLLKRAIDYIDNEIEKEYNLYLRNKNYKPSNYNGIHYLYARSFFLDKYPLNAKGKQIRDYFLKVLEKEKFNQNLQSQAMLSLVFHRYGKSNQAKELLIAIKDNSVESDEMGMYWKSNHMGWLWYQAPIETQAILIEAFNEISDDVESVENMKIWLLKNRQTNHWHSTKATTEAIYALMHTGKDWVNSENGISVKIGGETLDFKALEKEIQSGSGYVKTSWDASEINSSKAEINISKKSPGTAWGAMYWQYFEDLDKITSAETAVKLKKELFIKKNSNKGPILTKITEKTPIQIGDLVTVRLEIQTDRLMEFVHLKDMRASGFEPINMKSSYKFQEGLGYYESTRDAATHFFIDRMPKGTYVFEYDLRANNTGEFSNGITSLQNMYAPELSAQSEGIRVEIK